MGVSRYLWGLPAAIALFSISWVVTGMMADFLKIISVALLVIVTVGLIVQAKR